MIKKNLTVLKPFGFGFTVSEFCFKNFGYRVATIGTHCLNNGITEIVPKTGNF